MEQKQKIIADKLREIMVESLKLPMKPEDISYDISLFSDGIGIDSLDILELVIAIEREFDVLLTSDHYDDFKNVEILSNCILSLIENNIN